MRFALWPELKPYLRSLGELFQRIVSFLIFKPRELI